jgi:hypothetical protein
MFFINLNEIEKFFICHNVVTNKGRREEKVVDTFSSLSDAKRHSAKVTFIM